ncbi:hypothetical protein O9929_13640 [Vibrio lentus]|nr:hypothetical protein [Vibrio lentus]
MIWDPGTLGGGMYLSVGLRTLDLASKTSENRIAAAFTIYVVGGYTAVVWTDTVRSDHPFAGFILMAVMSS